MQILSDYPWYFSLLCLLCGAAYSVALYHWGRHTESLPPWARRGLTALRFLSVSLIAWLLLAPMVKRDVHQREKPIILVAQDNTQSIALSGDTISIDPVIRELEKDYDVRRYTFGEKLREGNPAGYEERSTDMASALSDLRDSYEGRNVGALLLVSDGIFNQGFSPLHACQGLPYPIYCLGLGDTSVRRDASIAHLRYNRVAYLGNQFPLEITIAASKLKGERKRLSVTHNGRTLFAKELTYTSNDHAATEQVVLTADQAGLQHYTVHIAEAEGEASTENNTRTFTLEVIDGHQKVLLLASAPHPDIAALRGALEANQNYEVASALASDFKGSLSEFDLVVLHNLPSQAHPEISLPPDVPALFVIGQQTDLNRFNNLHLGLEIHSRISRFNESTPLCNPAFVLFSLPDDMRSRLEHFPPLSSPFGDYRLSANTQSLLTAKIGAMQSGMPLMAFGGKGGTRYGFVCGEGLWRWRLADYGANNSHETFDALITKAVVYTSMKTGKERLRVESKQLYGATEEIVLDAMLYDENFELVNTPELELTLGKQQYLFNRTGGAYSLNLGTLAPGHYSYRATTTFNRQQYSTQGSFSVEDLQIEGLSLVADHSLLNTLASQTGGALLSREELGNLPETLRQRDDIKTLIYSHSRYSTLLSLPWLLALILLLLGAEWITRKYNGEI